jgi:hypothetical protein
LFGEFEAAAEAARSLALVFRSFFDRSAIILGDATLEIVRKRIEAPLPKPPVCGNPGIGLLHGFRFERQDMVSSVPAPLKQASALENAQVLGDRGPGNSQRSRQLTGSRFAAPEALKNHAPRRIGKSSESRAQARGSCFRYHRLTPSLFNYLVKYGNWKITR